MISKDLIGDTITEDHPHQFSGFASDLGIQDFPEQLLTTLGNGLPLIRQPLHLGMGDNGDLQAVLYVQSRGCISLKLFND